MRKLALKKLTASDLTFFEWHFRNHNAGNQKAINLNADVFVSRLYPSLPEVALASNGRLPIDLYVYGPALAQELNFQRKIIKSGTYKNWRLDGEFIYDPPADSARFHGLVAGDIVVFEFGGEVTPNVLKTFFVSQAAVEDRPLHASLGDFLGVRVMAPIAYEELEALVRRSNPPEQHPIYELLLESDLEDAAQGGEVGLERLYSRRSGLRLSKSELAKAIKRVEEIGEIGEEFVNAYLQELKTRGGITEYHWESQENAVAPFDFWFEERGPKTFIDVKATTGKFERTVHISVPELESMRDLAEPYVLYRVYEIGENSAKLRTSSHMKQFATDILELLRKLPAGVHSDGISVKPTILTFSPEIEVTLGLDVAQRI